MTTHVNGHVGSLHMMTLPSGALCITAENPSTGASCAHIDPADLRDALADKPNLSVSWDERDFDFHIRRWNGQSVPSSEVDDEDALQALVTMTDVIRDELIEAGRPVPAWAAKPLTPGTITDEMVQSAWTAWLKGGPRNMHSMRLALRAALPEPEAAEAPQQEARPEIDPLPILDEVARLDGRLADTRRMKALWRETAREHIRRGRTYAGYREAMEASFTAMADQRDQEIGRVNALSDENDDLRVRAEKAEQERDRLRTVLDTTSRQRDEADKRARSLTADDVDVQLAGRLRRALRKEIPALETMFLHAPAVGNALTAALREHLRPTGAEELDVHVDASIRGVGPHPFTAEQIRTVANGLAEEGVRATGDDR